MSRNTFTTMETSELASTHDADRSVITLPNAPNVRVSVLTGHNLLKPPANPADAYSVLVNSVSPEWQSRTTDSGINKAFALQCSLDEQLEALNEALQAGKEQFKALNGSAINKAFEDKCSNEGQLAPTYGDHVTTPTFGALKEAGHTHVLHVLGADCSDREKRFPVPLFTPTGKATLATVFLAYYRALTRAHALLRDATGGAKGSKGGVGFIQIATGVFKADQPSCARMFALALRAWAVSAATELSETASGGVRQVTMCCGDAAQHAVLVAALKWAGSLSDAETEAEVAGVLIDETAGCWMDFVPAVHTAAQKTQGEQPDDSATPFKYPSLAAKGSFTLASLQTQEVLHFEL